MIKLEEPDKGQAWVVAFAACIINMILSGLSRMIGLLFVAVLDTYNVPRQEATIPFTVRGAFRCLAGPLVGLAGQRYGIRAVTFYGGVVAAAGAALCYLAPTVTWLTVFWGVMHGSGFAFANTLFQVVVNQYFEKHRATASGIALSGACVGSFVFPFMIESILDIFGLAGTFLILGGIIMHVLPPSLLLRTPPWIQDPAKYARLKALQIKQASAATPDAKKVTQTPAEARSSNEMYCSPRGVSFSEGPIENLEVFKRSFSQETTVLEQAAGKKGKCQRNVVCTLYKISKSPPLHRRNSWKHGSEASENNRMTSEVPTIFGDLDSKDKKLNDTLPRAEKKVAAPERQTTFWENFLAMLALYKNPAYMLISLCMAVYVMIYFPILTVIVDYSKDKGIPETMGKHLMNAMAAGDLIGRLCFGWLTDKKIITVPHFIMLSFILQGVFVALFPFALSFYIFMALLIFYGLMSGTILAHFPILVFKYVDQREQSLAMGCSVFVSGVASLTLPYLIGHFRDNVGSYDGVFYITGGISVIIGSLWLLEPAMVRIHSKNAEKMALKKKKAEEQRFENCKVIVPVTTVNEQKSS